jgi:hypothetical protein
MIAAQDKTLCWLVLKTLQGSLLYQHSHKILNLQKIQIFRKILILQEKHWMKKFWIYKKVPNFKCWQSHCYL